LESFARIKRQRSSVATIDLGTAGFDFFLSHPGAPRGQQASGDTVAACLRMNSQ